MDKFPIGTKRCGVFTAIIGIVVAFMLLYMGLWRTLHVAAFAAIGYFVGASENKADAVKALINKLFPPKGE